MGQSFPTATPSYNDTQGGETLGSAGAGNGLSRILDDYGLDLTATTQKIGTGASTPTINKLLTGSGVGTSVWSSTLAGLTLTSPVINTPTGDVVTITGTQTLTNKNLSSATNTFPDFYPVGTQYINLTNSANPSTYLPGQSASTWTADSGTVTVAKAASGTFATAGATGGAETHTLTAVESGTTAHGHSITDPSHGHDLTMSSAVGTGSTRAVQGNAPTSTTTSSTVVGNTTGISVNNSSPSSASSAHNNLQPYKVKYVWNRVS